MPVTTAGDATSPVTTAGEATPPVTNAGEESLAHCPATDGHQPFHSPVLGGLGTCKWVPEPVLSLNSAGAPPLQLAAGVP